MSEKAREKMKSQSPVLYYGIIVICVVLMFVGRWIPPFSPEITPAGMGVLGVFIGVVILWSTVGGSIWPSLLGIVAVGCTGYMSINDAVANSLGNFMVFNIICMMAMVSALTESGADEKMTKWLINRKIWEGKPYLFSFMFLFAFFLISAVTFALALVFVCWAILRKMAKEVGVTMRHPYFAAMTVFSVVATSLGEFVIPLKGWQYALCNILMMAAKGADVNYGVYIVTTFLLGIAILLIMVLSLRVIFRIDMTPIKSYRCKELTKEETRLSKSQIATVVVMFLAILLSIMTNYLHGEGILAQIISTLSLPGIFGISVAILCAIRQKDGQPVLNFGKVMKGMVWGPILLVGIAICLASALTAEECGFMAFFAKTLGPVMQGKPVFLVYAFIIIVACILTNVASNMGIGMMMIPVSIPICLAAGCNMNVAATVCIYSACFGFILPGSSATSPIMYSNPDLRKPEILKYTSFVVAVYIVLGCILFPALDAALR